MIVGPKNPQSPIGASEKSGDITTQKYEDGTLIQYRITRGDSLVWAINNLTVAWEGSKELVWHGVYDSMDDGNGDDLYLSFWAPNE